MRIESCKQPAYSHNRLALNCISNASERASAIQNDIPIRSDYIEGVPITRLHDDTRMIRSLSSNCLPSRYSRYSEREGR